MTVVAAVAAAFTPFACSLVVARRDRRRRVVDAARRPIGNRWAVQR